MVGLKAGSGGGGGRWGCVGGRGWRGVPKAGEEEKVAFSGGWLSVSIWNFLRGSVFYYGVQKSFKLKLPNWKTRVTRVLYVGSRYVSLSTLVRCTFYQFIFHITFKVTSSI